MIRVTTNGTLHNYRSHLMRSANNQQKAFTSVLTQRQFNSYAEDPAAATQAFRMRSARASAGQQIYNNKAVTGKFSTAWSIIDGIKNDIADEMGKIPALEGSSDTNLSVLKELGQVLKAGAKSIVQDMNGKYGEWARSRPWRAAATPTSPSSRSWARCSRPAPSPSFRI